MYCTENPILPGQKFLFSMDFLSVNYHIFKDLLANNFVSYCVGIAAIEKNSCMSVNGSVQLISWTRDIKIPNKYLEIPNLMCLLKI